MSENRAHPGIKKLYEQMDAGTLDRREFIRYATLLGLSATSAYAIAGFAAPRAARAADMPKGGILRVGMRVPDISTPHTFSWIYDSNILRQHCEYMTQTGTDNVTRPLLAESWDVTEDLKTWTLKLRKVNWHSGRPFTAEDVAWNIKHCLDPATGSSVVGLMKGYMLNEVPSGEKNDDGSDKMTTELWDANAIEIVDESTIRLNLKEAQVAVPEHLFHYPFGMLDPEEGGNFGVGSNGTGAFELTEIEIGVKAVLKARSDYWGDGPHLDGIEFIDLGDNAQAVAAALASKQIHGMYEGNVEQLQLVKALPHVNFYDVATADTAVVRMRVDQPEFEDPRVRKAFRLATEQGQVLEIAHNNVGAKAEHHHVSPVHPDYKELPFMGQDIAAAKDLLNEAGYPNGIDVEIACKKDPVWELTAIETMVSQWAEAGIRCKINVMPSAQFWDVWDKVPFGFTTWAHRPLAFMVLGLAYRSGVPWNETAYNNPEFDELLTKAEGTLDLEERRELIGQLEMIMQEDGPISQPIWRGLYTGYDKAVKGFQMHPTRYIFGNELAMESA